MNDQNELTEWEKANTVGYYLGDKIKPKAKIEPIAKISSEKRKWSALPIVLIEPLADLMQSAIDKGKYKKFSCLGEVGDPDEEFYDAMMRHVKDSQIDPLSLDPETECYNLASVAFNALMRLHHCKKKLTDTR